MTKLLILLLLSMGCVALILVVGCNIEDTPTGEDETLESVFSLFFAQPDDAMGELVSAPFRFMDSIKIAGGGVGKPAHGNKVKSEQVTLTWLAATSYWYCTAIIIEETDTLMLTDSIQFRYLNGPVQYPLHNDSLTQIISYASLVVKGTGIDTAYGSQNMIFTHNPNTGILVLDGTGGSSASINENDCAVEWDFGQTFTDVTWNTLYLHDNETGDLYCPYEGSIVYNGSFKAGCFGSDIDINGDWIVTETFDYGDITYAVSQDSSWFTYYDTCETGFSEEMSQADTTFVEDMFGNGAIEHFLEGFDMAFALMVHEGYMAPEDNPGQNTIIIDTVSEYVYDNGWHRFHFEAMIVENMDTIFFAGVDSLRALIGENFPADSIANLAELMELQHRSHYSLLASGTEGIIEGVIHHSLDATINNTGNDTTVTFHGNTWDTVTVVSGAGITGVCEVDLTLHQTINYMVLDLEAEGECPRSGTVTSNFGMDIACESGDGLNIFLVNGGWTVTVVANGNNTVTVTYENDAGTISWSRTVDCINMSPSIVSINNRMQ